MLKHSKHQHGGEYLSALSFPGIQCAPENETNCSVTFFFFSFDIFKTIRRNLAIELNIVVLIRMQRQPYWQSDSDEWILWMMHYPSPATSFNDDSLETNISIWNTSPSRRVSLRLQLSFFSPCRLVLVWRGDGGGGGGGGRGGRGYISFSFSSCRAHSS